MPEPGSDPPQASLLTPQDQAVGRLQATAKAQLYAGRVLLVRQEYDRRAGKLHDVEQCHQRQLRQFHAVRNAVLSFPRLAAALVGATQEHIERVLLERAESILDAFASGSSWPLPK